jgi:hypothetical protein
MASRRKSDLPFGSQFSPAQIELVRVLDLLELHGGATSEFTDAIREEYFSSHAKGNPKQQRELAKNVRLALRGYGIISDDDHLTNFGTELMSLRMHRDRLYAALAKHILLDLKGIDLLRAVSDMKVARLETKLVDIARELERRGIHVPESGTHISSMREWLEAAKVLDGHWGVNEDRLRDLIGHGLDQVDELGQFSPEQRAFVEALVAMPGDGPFNSAEVARLATAQHHVVYDPKNLRYQVLFPLRDSGYLEVTKTTAGRGAKPYMVKPSSKFNREFIVPVLQALAKAASVPPDILRRPLKEIVVDLTSPNKDVKGKALEILAVNVCRILGLQIVGWRLRSRETGGQEVDVIADGTNFVFLRWEIQCKNTRTVSSDDVAREVGVALGNHAGVVLMITTGRFTEPARRYMNRILQTTAMNVMLLDGSDLKEIVGNPASAARVLGRHAKRIRNLKRSEVIP